MPRLAERAERRKLARALDTGDCALEFLDDCAASQLRSLREGVTDAMFKRHASSFRLLAGLSGLVPAGITAKIAQKALGAFLSGRVTGEMPVKRAVGVAKKLPADFLADISLSLEPTRAQAVIAAMPTDMVETVAGILVERAEYITMGRFVGAVSEQALFTVVDLLDDAALLHTGFYVEDTGRLDRIVASLPDERLLRIISTATQQDLWPEALSLVQVVGDKQKGRLGDLVAGEDASVLDSLVLVAQAQGLWPEVMTAVAGMTGENQRTVVNLPSVTEPEVLDALMTATYANDLWAIVLPLVASMSEESQRTVANLPAVTEPEVLDALMTATYASDLWATALPLIAQMAPATRQSIVSAVLERDDAVLLGWLNSVDASALLSQSLGIFGELPPALREQVVARGQKLTRAGGGEKLTSLVATLETQPGQ